MSKLIWKIAQKVTVDYCRLSVVKSQDGFLAQDVVRNLLSQELGVEVILGSQLRQRIHFELQYKQNDGRRFLYVCHDTDGLLPDMRQEAYVTAFSIADVFPLFADKSLLRRQPFVVLEMLYDGFGSRRVSLAEAPTIVSNMSQLIEVQRKQSADYLRSLVAGLVVDWNKPYEAAHGLSSLMLQCLRAGVLDEVQPSFDRFNQSFQEWIDANYFATLVSSPLLKARSVNKILPHIGSKHGNDEKVALVVVDGFSYWQYTILAQCLERLGFHREEDATLAWLPSITMLSRQAIFRGDMPRQDYRQSPDNEKCLWNGYWLQQGIGSYEIQYIGDADTFCIDANVKRLAVVTVEMDEKMHSSADYHDLCSLTENWCPKIVQKIKAMLDLGFVVYLTSDHGSVLSEGWRPLSQAEKVFLYRDGSRGARHLIYNNAKEQEDFLNTNAAVGLLKHDNWLCMRGSRCFARENTRMITHGGSHWMELVVPLVKITR